MNNNTKHNLFFGLMQGFYWAACVTFNVFLVYYLETQHILSSQIGLLLTLGTISGVISQYFWGYLCDKLNGIKKIMSLCIVGTVAAVWALPAAHNYSMILAVYICFMFSQPVIPSLIDTWTIRFSQSTQQNYSKLRSIGSLSFAVMSSLFGYFVEKYFYHAMAIGFTLFSTLLLFIVLISSDIKTEEKAADKFEKPQLSVLSLFTNIKFMLFLSGIMLIFVPNSFISTYMLYIAKSVNGAAHEMSLAFGLAALLELPLFLLFSRIAKKISYEKLFLVGSLFLIGRILQLLLIRTPYGLYMNALFHGAGFPLLTSCFRNYVPKIVPKNLIVTAQALAGAFVSGVPYIISAYFGGMLIQKYDLSVSYTFFGIIGSMALVPFFILFCLSKNNKRFTTE